MSNIQDSKFKIQNSNRGFTIMEIVVVIFIISIGLMGVLSLVTQNIQIEYVNKNMIMASQLSQEGLELVRNIRDNNWVDDNDWKTGGVPNSNSDIAQDGNYAISIDASGPSIEIFDISGSGALGISDNDARLYLDSDGFYTHLTLPGNATSTNFSRIIVIDEENPNDITVSCIVEWKIRANTHQYTAQTKLYNWR